MHPQGRTSTQKRPKNRGVTSEELKAKAELSAARLGTCPGTESGCQDLDSICSLFHFLFFFCISCDSKYPVFNRKLQNK